jgi:hypothetical protein
MTLPTRLGMLFRTAASLALGVRIALSGATIIFLVRRLSAVRVLSAFAANLGHVCAVGAYRLAALSSCFTCFVGTKFVRCSFLVGGMSTLTSDLLLLVVIHRSKSTIGGVLLGHLPGLL